MAKLYRARAFWHWEAAPIGRFQVNPRPMLQTLLLGSSLKEGKKNHQFPESENVVSKTSKK
ncbi:hypothetical protein [Mesorhizobium sp.]|uniref:hypothetical protein n=1 Tax=Mesorhizobium sp. TaxID=1871066 RepID=UPI000FE57D38|nr:hypothetical protein [Mesorhizobium sp.]RWA80562.1 MAG: hypothetical protein EOQ30_22430 [Mesorhizobium sp.]